MRFLHRLGHHVARRHLDVLAIDAAERHLGHASERDFETLAPHLAFQRGSKIEPAQLRQRSRLARSELDAPIRDQVEHRDSLGDARGMVVAGRGEHDPMPEPHLGGALARRGQKNLGRAGMRVLFQKVMLHFPHVGEAELVRQLDLVERILDQLQLALFLPRPWKLMLIEKSKSHKVLPSLFASLLDPCAVGSGSHVAACVKLFEDLLAARIADQRFLDLRELELPPIALRIAEPAIARSQIAVISSRPG